MLKYVVLGKLYRAILTFFLFVEFFLVLIGIVDIIEFATPFTFFDVPFAVAVVCRVLIFRDQFQTVGT